MIKEIVLTTLKELLKQRSKFSVQFLFTEHYLTKWSPDVAKGLKNCDFFLENFEKVFPSQDANLFLNDLWNFIHREFRIVQQSISVFEKLEFVFQSNLETEFDRNEDQKLFFPWIIELLATCQGRKGRRRRRSFEWNLQKFSKLSQTLLDVFKSDANSKTRPEIWISQVLPTPDTLTLGFIKAMKVFEEQETKMNVLNERLTPVFDDIYKTDGNLIVVLGLMLQVFCSKPPPEEMRRTSRLENIVFEPYEVDPFEYEVEPLKLEPISYSVEKKRCYFFRGKYRPIPKFTTGQEAVHFLKKVIGHLDLDNRNLHLKIEEACKLVFDTAICFECVLCDLKTMDNSNPHLFSQQPWKTIQSGNLKVMQDFRDLTSEDMWDEDDDWLKKFRQVQLSKIFRKCPNLHEVCFSHEIDKLEQRFRKKNTEERNPILFKFSTLFRFLDAVGYASLNIQPGCEGCQFDRTLADKNAVKKHLMTMCMSMTKERRLVLLELLNLQTNPGVPFVPSLMLSWDEAFIEKFLSDKIEKDPKNNQDLIKQFVNTLAVFS